MSYILDALKKLEKKRMKETLPGLLSRHELPRAKADRRIFGRYLTAFALLINAVLLLWWLRPWEARSPEYVNPVSQSKIAPLPDADEGVRAPSGTVPNATDNRGFGTMYDNETAMKEQPLYKREPVNRNDVISPEDSVKPVEGKGASGGQAKTSVMEIHMNDLPLSVRQELPRISVSGHFYSDNPGSRIVVINGRVVHEGAEVAQGLMLERINSDGLVFFYQGYRFRMGVF